MRHIFLPAILIALGACGTRGGLDLPPGPAPEPLFGSTAAAGPVPVSPAADAKRGGDLSTTTKPAR